MAVLLLVPEKKKWKKTHGAPLFSCLWCLWYVFGVLFGAFLVCFLEGGEREGPSKEGRGAVPAQNDTASCAKRDFACTKCANAGCEQKKQSVKASDKERSPKEKYGARSLFWSYDDLAQNVSKYGVPRPTVVCMHPGVAGGVGTLGVCSATRRGGAKEPGAESWTWEPFWGRKLLWTKAGRSETENSILLVALSLFALRLTQI